MSTEPRERPILFSGAMVRAILDGRKTQTRRVVTRIPWRPGVNPEFSHARAFVNGVEWRIAGSEEMSTGFRCPYGKPGDRLWVRERVWVDRSTGEFRWYAHQDVFAVDRERERVKLRPAIHMPRALSRILLEITDVRVERLTIISEADVIAEGCKVCPRSGSKPCFVFEGTDYDAAGLCHSHPQTAFQILWDSINAARGFGWDANPWVWAITFKRIEAAT